MKRRSFIQMFTGAVVALFAGLFAAKPKPPEGLTLAKLLKCKKMIEEANRAYPENHMTAFEIIQRKKYLAERYGGAYRLMWAEFQDENRELMEILKEIS